MVGGMSDSEIAKAGEEVHADEVRGGGPCHDTGDVGHRADLLSPDDSVTRLRGVGDKLAERLSSSLGVSVISDLVHCFPRRTREILDLEEPSEDALDLWVRMTLRVLGVRLSWLPGRRSLVTVSAS